MSGQEYNIFLKEACETIFRAKWKEVFDFCSEHLSFPVSKCGDAFGEILMHSEIQMKFCGRGEARLTLVEEVTKRHMAVQAGIRLYRPPFFVTLGGPGLGKTRMLKDLWDNALIPSPNNSPSHPLALSNASKSDAKSPTVQPIKFVEPVPIPVTNAPISASPQSSPSCSPISSTPPPQPEVTGIFKNTVKFYLSELERHYEGNGRPDTPHRVLSSSLLSIFCNDAGLGSFCENLSKIEPLKDAEFGLVLHFVVLALGCHKWSGALSILLQFDEIQEDIRGIDSKVRGWGTDQTSKSLIRLLCKLMANPLKIRPNQKALTFIHMAGLTDTSLINVIFKSAGTYIELPASLAKIESIFAAFDSFNFSLALKFVPNRNGKRVLGEVAPDPVVEWEESSRMKILLTLLGGRFRSLEVLCSNLAPKNGEPFTSAYFPEPARLSAFLGSTSVPTDKRLNELATGKGLKFWLLALIMWHERPSDHYSKKTSKATQQLEFLSLARFYGLVFAPSWTAGTTISAPFLSYFTWMEQNGPELRFADPKILMQASTWKYSLEWRQWEDTCATMISLRTSLRKELKGDVTMCHFLGDHAHWGTNEHVVKKLQPESKAVKMAMYSMDDNDPMVQEEIELSEKTHVRLSVSRHKRVWIQDCPNKTFKLRFQWPRVACKGTMRDNLVKALRKHSVEVLQEDGELKIDSEQESIGEEEFCCPMLCDGSCIDAFQFLKSKNGKEIFVGFQFKSSEGGLKITQKAIEAEYRKLFERRPSHGQWFHVIITNKPLSDAIQWDELPCNLAVVGPGGLGGMFSIFSNYTRAKDVQQHQRLVEESPKKSKYLCKEIV